MDRERQGEVTCWIVSKYYSTYRYLVQTAAMRSHHKVRPVSRQYKPTFRTPNHCLYLHKTQCASDRILSRCEGSAQCWTWNRCGRQLTVTIEPWQPRKKDWKLRIKMATIIFNVAHHIRTCPFLASTATLPCSRYRQPTQRAFHFSALKFEWVLASAIVESTLSPFRHLSWPSFLPCISFWIVIILRVEISSFEFSTPKPTSICHILLSFHASS